MTNQAPLATVAKADNNDPQYMVITKNEKNVPYMDKNKYNPIFYTETVFQNLPAGVSMAASVVNIPDRDLWDSDKAGFLKGDNVMLSANGYSKLAQAAGIKLERVTNEVTETKSGPVLLIEYKASMIQQDGTVISDIGGKEEAYTPGKNHSREKIDTKARRNALRRLMSIPLTMPKAEFSKPMVIFKPVFSRGGDVDHVVDSIEAKKDESLKALYGGTEPPAAPTPNGFEDLKNRVEQAQTVADLDEITKVIQTEAKITPEERGELGKLWIAKRNKTPQ